MLLRRRREACGLTQEALAALAELSVDAISLLERGLRQRPHPSTVTLLATALGLTAAECDEFLAASREPAAGLATTAPPELQPPATSFLGRQDQVEELRALLQGDGPRLLTLTGPAGVGKTRLALAAFAAAGPAFAGGVVAVSLAPLSDPRQVPTAIQHALGVRDDGADALEAIVAHCRRRRLLLLLDNFEHVLAAAPLLVQVVAGCQEARLLVTSRVALRVRGEHQLAVPPLPPPEPCAVEPAVLGRCPAVALFVDRARAVVPGFRLTAANAGAVAEICRRLDGLPLALELAAPWVRLLPPGELLGRLDDPLALLVDGPGDLPQRQRTLRAALRWSCDLLSADQVALFRRLSVFAGSASLEAVEEVCQAAGPLPDGALRGLAALIDHSLVLRREGGPRPRVAMLQTVREYAAELLERSGEAERTAGALLEHHAAITGAAAAGLRGPGQAEWMELLAAEYENVRASMMWARGHGRAEAGLRMAGACWRYWEMGGSRREGLTVLEDLLAAGPGVEPGVRAEALLAAGSIAISLAELDLAVRRFDEALAIFREPLDPRGQADALNGLAVVAMGRGELEGAERLLREALELYRAADDREGAADALSGLGVTLAQRGDWVEGSARCEESLAARRAAGDTYGIVVSLVNLAAMARRSGDVARAESELMEAVELSRRLGVPAKLAAALHNLADLVRDRGEHQAARELYEESVRLFDEVGNEPAAATGLEDLAWLTWAGGRQECAARLYGAAAALREARGAAPQAVEYQEHVRVLDAIVGELGQAEAAALFAAGRSLSLESALAEAFDA